MCDGREQELCVAWIWSEEKEKRVTPTFVFCLSYKFDHLLLAIQNLLHIVVMEKVSGGRLWGEKIILFWTVKTQGPLDMRVEM